MFGVRKFCTSNNSNNKKEKSSFSTANAMQVLHKRAQHGPTSGASFSIDVSRLASSEDASSPPVAIRRVVCGPTFVAVLTSKGEVFMAVVTDTQRRSQAASMGQEEWTAALAPVARLRGVFVVDIAASAVSIVAVSHIGHVYTLPAVAFTGGGVERAVIPTCPAGNDSAAVPFDDGVPRFQVSAGAVFFIVTCRESPSVFAGGLNQSGQLGVGSDDERLEVSGGALREVIFTPPLSSPVRSIHCGGCHTVALVPTEDHGSGRDDCSVWVWGRNNNGQLGLPLEEYRQSSSPILLSGVSAIMAACGDYFTVFLSRVDGGRIGVCGRNATNQLGPQGTTQDVSPLRWVSLTALIPSLCVGSEPSAPNTTDLISTIACGGGYGVGHTIITTRDGRVFGCGSDNRGQLGGGGSMDAYQPLSSEVVPQPWAGKNVGASAGWFHSVIWCPDVMRTSEGANLSRKPSRPAGALDRLPVETLDFIVSFLKPRDALSLSATCTLWRDLVRHSDALWAGTMRRLYPLSYERVSRSLAEQKERAGGFVHYRDGVDFVEELSRLNKERFGFVSGGTAPVVDSSKDAEAPSKFSFRSLFSSMPWGRSRPQHRILFLGLDAAGKTSLLYGLKSGEVVTTIPTIGFNVETITSNRVEFTCWDVGGPDRIRSLWVHYFAATSAIIYVIDANDKERLGEACQELQWAASRIEARNLPVLVLANKMDLPNPAGVEEVALLVREALDVVNEDRTRPMVSLLHRTRSRGTTSPPIPSESSGTTPTPVRPWRVQGCSFLLRKGMREGLDWLEGVLQ